MAQVPFSELDRIPLNRWRRRSRADGASIRVPVRQYSVSTFDIGVVEKPRHPWCGILNPVGRPANGFHWLRPVL